MGIIISLLLISKTVKRFIEINKQINGQWFTYLYNLFGLWIRRKQCKTNRIVRHQVWKDDVRHSGIIPFDHEWLYDSPSKDQSEYLLIYGVNSLKQSLKISINYEIISDLSKRNAKISLRFDDNDGNHYTLEDESEIEYKNKEYRVCGLAIQILSPFRKKRIRFRGYLTKNGQQLVYVKFRFLCLSVGKVYDFIHDFDDHFMTKEWIKCRERPSEQQFENRFEQFCQIKGTLNVEDSPQKILFLWGSVSKKYLENKPINRRIIRIVGFNKKGIGFDLGFLTNNNGFEYRFGFLFDKIGAFKRLKSLSLQKYEFEELLRNSPNISFQTIFGENEYQFRIKQNNNSLANDLLINGNEGMCYIIEEIDRKFHNNIFPIKKITKDLSLVLGLNENNAKSVELSGGKGSSLAVLINLSQELIRVEYKETFSVPNGVVVTTNSYESLFDEYEDLQKDIIDLENSTELSKHDLRIKCENIQNLFSNYKLPKIIGKEIENKLNQLFDDYENRLFAVRSSAASEDSEEMSAAGQMTTYLGVKGIENVKQSVMKCWSSQFSYIAYEYKRCYGQLINSPMAVVIQEMIGCESAGVMFTCDPISGDERVIEITGNFGLGESVVSASSEPDLIRLTVNIESNSSSKKRTVAGIQSKIIGKKSTSIKLVEGGGTLEEEVTHKEKFCLTDEDLIRLGDLGLRIHHYYGNARDIEWGLKGGQIFMLQSRPVTNLDNSYTDYEIMHEMDSSHPTEFEIYTRTHWGENYPGASSWICLQWFWANRSAIFRSALMDGRATEDDYDPYLETMGIQYNQIMFNLSNGWFDVFSDYPTTKGSQQFVLAMCGHHIEDQEVLDMFKERRINKKKPSLFGSIKSIINLIYALVFGPKNLIKTKNKFIKEQKFDLVQLLTHSKDSKQVWKTILDNYYQINSTAMKNHGPVAMGSGFKNSVLRQVLEGASENNSHLDDDFNLMTSSCNEVISAEVPNILKDIAQSIEDKQQFRKLSDEKALQMLRQGTDEASHKFKKFIKKHGHRGNREMDPMHPPWRDDPIPCIKTIKGILSANESQFEPKIEKSIDKVMDELKTPLSLVRKLLISKVLLPWCRSGVGYRELSKYFMIWLTDQQRQGFRYLAHRMVSEGLIPSEDIFFYLTTTEVDSLCNGDRDPSINVKARLRKRVYPKINKYKFQEFIKGPQMTPINFEDQIIPTNLSNDSIKMSGTAVSNGTVKGRVCVAEDISEANLIQSEDILITYSTDIGWSPYFPLLSGIVTEIGGTISHGSVIAREYGIPCLVAVEGVCRAFKTGDICILDSKSATLSKVSSVSDNSTDCR